MSENDIDDSMPTPSEGELMRLIHADSAVWMRAIKKLDDTPGDNVLLVLHLISMLHQATQSWLDPEH